ncbi:MAG: hypothetical protein AAF678_02165 [Pseudomonadota bacterium]
MPIRSITFDSQRKDNTKNLTVMPDHVLLSVNAQQSRYFDQPGLPTVAAGRFEASKLPTFANLFGFQLDDSFVRRADTLAIRYTKQKEPPSCLGGSDFSH